MNIYRITFLILTLSDQQRAIYRAKSLHCKVALQHVVLVSNHLFWLEQPFLKDLGPDLLDSVDGIVSLFLDGLNADFIISMG